MNTLQKESFSGQAHRTFGEASRSCSIGELLAFLEGEKGLRNARVSQEKMKQSPFSSTGELLALLGVQRQADFLPMNYLHPSVRRWKLLFLQCHVPASPLPTRV